MKLNKYVVTTLVKGEEHLFNTVSKSKLPLTASKQELENELFLEGQEDECITRTLFGSTPEKCNFEIIPTWECNLRCTHCSVMHQLKTKDTNVLDVDKLVLFIQRYVKAYSPRLTSISTSYVGGEPLLRAAKLNEFLDKLDVPVKTTTSITTNAACDMGEAELSFLSKMNQITVSVDGIHEHHNTQRKVLLGDFDPYIKTTANLKILVERFGMNVWVQAAVRDEFITTEYKQRFHEAMLRIGVYKGNIQYNCIHPTQKKPEPQKTYLKSLTMAHLRPIPCCKFRYMKNLIIDSSNNIFTEFFDASTNSKLGSLDDGFEVIEQRHRDMITSSMPALKDPTCMQCPVIGYCWGGCVSGTLLSGDKPSQFCGQAQLVTKVDQLSKAGRIYDYRG